MIRILILLFCLVCSYGCIAPTESTPMSVDEIGASGGAPAFNGKSQPNPMVMGQASPINGLQAVFPEASTYTVQFLVETPSPPPVNPPAGIFATLATEAIVQWMLDGNQITRRVSVGSGVSISGTAQGVQVTLVDKSLIFGTPIAGFTGKYSVTVSVTPGVRATEPTPVCLFPLGNNTPPDQYGSFELIANTFIDIPIAPDAGITSVQVLPAHISFAGAIVPGDGNVLVEFFTAFGIFTTLAGGFDPTIMDGFVPIPPGANTVRLRTRAVPSPINFQVSFGVDG